MVDENGMVSIADFAKMHDISVQQVEDIMTHEGYPPASQCIFKDENGKWEEMFLLRTVFPEQVGKPGLSSMKLQGRMSEDDIAGASGVSGEQLEAVVVEDHGWASSPATNPRATDIKVKRIGGHDLPLPTFGSAGAACFDLRLARFVKEFTRPNGAKFAVYGTGFSYEVPAGKAMMVYIRSGVGCKSTVTLSNCVGVIDSDYRGEVFATLDITNADPDFKLNVGDRIAQAMIIDVPAVTLTEVEELSSTDRGEGGHGSTGVA